MTEDYFAQEGKAETAQPMALSLVDSLYLDMAVDVAAEGGNDFTPIQEEVIKKWIDKALTAGYVMAPGSLPEDGFFNISKDRI